MNIFKTIINKIQKSSLKLVEPLLVDIFINKFGEYFYSQNIGISNF